MRCGGARQIANLPRKWNVCVVGTHDLYEHPHINDLAFIPATKDGVFGFNIWVSRGPTRLPSPRICGPSLPPPAKVVCMYMGQYRSMGLCRPAMPAQQPSALACNPGAAGCFAPPRCALASVTTSRTDGARHAAH